MLFETVEAAYINLMGSVFPEFDVFFRLFMLECKSTSLPRHSLDNAKTTHITRFNWQMQTFATRLRGLNVLNIGGWASLSKGTIVAVRTFTSWS